MEMINRNTEVNEEIRDVLKLQQNFDGVPGKILPVVNVNPKHARVTNVVESVRTTSASATTAYTAPSDKDFYLTGIFIQHMCDNADDGSEVVFRCVINGAVKKIVTLGKLTLTAFSQGFTIPFPNPIKVDRGSVMDFDTNATVGNRALSMSVFGYLVENIKA